MNDNLAAGLSAWGSLAWEDLQSLWGVSLSVLKVVENTAVSHVNCRVTHVCDCRLTPWMLHSLLQSSLLSVFEKKDVVTLSKVRSMP